MKRSKNITLVILSGNSLLIMYSDAKRFAIHPYLERTHVDLALLVLICFFLFLFSGFSLGTNVFPVFWLLCRFSDFVAK